MRESEVTGNCHASFGERDGETRAMRVVKVRAVPTLLSPILANIYLHELDCYVDTLIADFNKGKARHINPEYAKVKQQARQTSKKIEQETNTVKRATLLEQKKVMQRRKLEIPSQDQHDPDFRRLRYCRYADDFVLAAICSKSEAEDIYRKISVFLKDQLKLNVSQHKSGLKHSTEAIR